MCHRAVATPQAGNEWLEKVSLRGAEKPVATAPSEHGVPSTMQGSVSQTMETACLHPHIL